MLLSFLFQSAHASPLVEAATTYMGRPYAFGGRGSTLDCMGLVFRAWTDSTGQSWRGLSVNPTTLVSQGQLGPAVVGLDGVETHRIDWSLFRPGDIIYFLGRQENPSEPSLVTLDTPMWVWHMGIFVGGDQHTFVAGDHFAGEVATMPLKAYLTRHSATYQGIFVTRPTLAPANGL